MIVKNEAAHLAECLDSVAKIADELIIGDTGSTDNTREIAINQGAQVFNVPWEDDFAKARNTVLNHAQSDWLLHLDADEVLDPAGAKQIREIVDQDGQIVNEAKSGDAVEVTLANYCNDTRAWRWVPVDANNPWAREYAGYIAVPLLRLFRNRRGFEYREPVHENITESVAEQGGVILCAPILIHHYGYAVSPELSREKALRYRAIAEKKVTLRSQDPKAWHDFAEASLACGQVEQAEDACRQALQWSPNNLAASSTLVTILLNRGDLDEARRLLENLESLGCAVPHVVTALGAIACRQGRLTEARQRLEAVVAVQPGAIQAWLYLARTLDLTGDLAGTHETLEKAKQAAPGIQETDKRIKAHALRLEAESLYTEQNFMQALRTLLDAMQCDPDDPIAYNDLGVVLTAMGEYKKAAEAFTRALLLAPGLTMAQENLKTVSLHAG